MSGTEQLQSLWQSLLERLHCGDLVAASTEEPTREWQLSAARYMFSELAHAYVMAFHTDPDYPTFLPYCGEVFNFGGPNPDAVYYFTSIDGNGAYRITGVRNTVHFVDLQPGFGMWGFPDSPGTTFPSTVLDDFSVAPDGSFEILVSNAKPDGYTGNWLEIDPRVDYILVRQFAYDWQEKDANLAIERLDVSMPRPELTPMETERRLHWLTEYFNGSVDAFVHLRRRAAADKVNDFTFADFGVGTLARQTYHEGNWDLGEDDLLLCEVRVPDGCFYWNVQIANLFWETLDSRRQSSVNGAQAHTDEDGVTRLVFGAREPGLPNWLDTGGLPRGDIVWRWLKAPAVPEISTRLIKFDELDTAVPAHARRIDAAEREQRLRQRYVQAQLRRKW